MGKTYSWDSSKSVWIERRTLAFGYDAFDFYVLDSAGAEVNGKTLRQIPDDSYKSELENIDVYIVKKAGIGELNKATVQDPDAVIVVGMDQWVITNTSKRVAICTSGIIGCMGVGFIAGDKAFVTHLLDGFEKEAAWPEYKEQLKAPLEIMGHVDTAYIVASSSIYVDKCALVASYLEEKGIGKGQQKQAIAGGFALRVVGQNNWLFVNIDKPMTLFPGKSKTLVSSSARYCTNSGNLSAKATDSRGD